MSDKPLMGFRDFNDYLNQIESIANNGIKATDEIAHGESFASAGKKLALIAGAFGKLLLIKSNLQTIGRNTATKVKALEEKIATLEAEIKELRGHKDEH